MRRGFRDVPGGDHPGMNLADMIVESATTKFGRALGRLAPVVVALAMGRFVGRGRR